MLENKIFIEAAKKFGTPHYLYDLPAVQKRLQEIRSVLPKAVKLYYAVKANPNLQLLKKIETFVDGLDISSGGELQQSKLAGYDFGPMNFAGPGKTENELEFALKNKIGSLSIESLTDLIRTNKIANKLKTKANILIRINPEKLVNKFAMKMGGKATQFGIDEAEIEKVINSLKNYEHIKLIGFHVYSGTQCLDTKALLENYAYTLKLVESYVKKYKLTVLRINLGGGWGIPYFSGEEPLNIKDLKPGLAQLIADLEKNTRQKPEYIIELGRYIIAEAGYYVTKILNKKTSLGSEYYILDGGMHHNLAAAGHLGQIIKKNYLIKNISRENKDLIKVNLAGPLCTPLDTMAQNLELPKSEVGDILVFQNSGAYAYSSSPLLFLSHETPVEILYNGKKLENIRKSFDISSFN